MQLGEYLVSQGLITEDHLQYAIAVQQRSGGRLGEIIVALDLVKRRDLYKALSSLWDLPYVELNTRKPQAISKLLPLEDAVRLRATVYGEEESGAILVATAEAPELELEQILQQHFPGRQCQYAVTTHWDVDHYLHKCFQATILDLSIYALYRKRREYSAFTVMTNAQFAAVTTLMIAGALALWVDPKALVIAINIGITVGFFVLVLFKFSIGMAGARSERDIPVNDTEVAALRDDELPTYTILVPVYREANIVHQVLDHVAAVDYPKQKLEILILIEEDDVETWDAARATQAPDYVHLIRIPHGIPKTKPKACNVGLSFARGQYLVIYDAEDKPERDQLKKAVVSFRKGGRDLICVQCALNYFNAGENWLTRMFTLEYSYWFDYMLPGLQALHFPIPLGGTSNHFRTDRLLELAGWDPFNVTEDADLGIRASALGYRVGIINSTTYEEANTQVGNWVRQRSRWIKGYMQTTLVHTRHPVRLLREVGLWQAFGFGLLIGGTPLAFLAYLPSLILYTFWLSTGTQALNRYFPQWVMYLGLFNLLIGNAFGIYLSMLAVFKRQMHGRLLLYALTNPLYWVLHSIASYKALWQLITRPFYWEKTVHGLTRQTR